MLMTAAYRDEVVRALLLATGHLASSSNDSVETLAATECSGLQSISQPTIVSGMRDSMLR